jgi:hypothetical protein
MSAQTFIKTLWASYPNPSEDHRRPFPPGCLKPMFQLAAGTNAVLGRMEEL